jgi:hypothetical protein
MRGGGGLGRKGVEGGIGLRWLYNTFRRLPTCGKPNKGGWVNKRSLQHPSMSAFKLRTRPGPYRLVLPLNHHVLPSATLMALVAPDLFHDSDYANPMPAPRLGWTIGKTHSSICTSYQRLFPPTATMAIPTRDLLVPLDLPKEISKCTSFKPSTKTKV